jgi:hypothetical protein
MLFSPGKRPNSLVGFGDQVPQIALVDAYAVDLSAFQHSGVQKLVLPDACLLLLLGSWWAINFAQVLRKLHQGQSSWRPVQLRANCITCKPGQGGA